MFELYASWFRGCSYRTKLGSIAAGQTWGAGRGG